MCLFIAPTRSMKMKFNVLNSGAKKINLLATKVEQENENLHHRDAHENSHGGAGGKGDRGTFLTCADVLQNKCNVICGTAAVRCKPPQFQTFSKLIYIILHDTQFCTFFPQHEYKKVPSQVSSSVSSID